MKDCVFCKVARGELPSTKIYEDEELFAFHDIAPMAPVHFLVIPKKHIANIMELAPEDSSLMGRMLYRAQELARDLGCAEKGARFLINCKSDGGQTVDHVHLHVLGGRAMRWPPG
jgi:histidine triad (HIT) family protein